MTWGALWTTLCVIFHHPWSGRLKLIFAFLGDTLMRTLGPRKLENWQLKDILCFCWWHSRYVNISLQSTYPCRGGNIHMAPILHQANSFLSIGFYIKQPFFFSLLLFFLLINIPSLLPFLFLYYFHFFCGLFLFRTCFFLLLCFASFIVVVLYIVGAAEARGRQMFRIVWFTFSCWQIYVMLYNSNGDVIGSTSARAATSSSSSSSSSLTHK